MSRQEGEPWPYPEQGDKVALCRAPAAHQACRPGADQSYLPVLGPPFPPLGLRFVNCKRPATLLKLSSKPREGSKLPQTTQLA